MLYNINDILLIIFIFVVFLGGLFMSETIKQGDKGETGESLNTKSEGLETSVKNQEAEIIELKETLLFKQRYCEAIEKIASVIISQENSDIVFRDIAEIVGQTLDIERCIIYNISYSLGRIIELGSWINEKAKDILQPDREYDTKFFVDAVQEMAKTKNYIESHFDNINPIGLASGAEKIIHEELQIKNEEEALRFRNS